MSDPKTDPIHKVQISDVDNPQDNSELDDTQLDQVSGGGDYGVCPACGSSPCCCGG